MSFQPQRLLGAAEIHRLTAGERSLSIDSFCALPVELVKILS
jgi:hypothetical protein